MLSVFVVLVAIALILAVIDLFPHRLGFPLLPVSVILICIALLFFR